MMVGGRERETLTVRVSFGGKEKGQLRALTVGRQKTRLRGTARHQSAHYVQKERKPAISKILLCNKALWCFRRSPCRAPRPSCSQPSARPMRSASAARRRLRAGPQVRRGPAQWSLKASSHLGRRLLGHAGLPAQPRSPAPGHPFAPPSSSSSSAAAAAAVRPLMLPRRCFSRDG